MATRLCAAPIRRARQLLSAAATTARSVAVAVPAMAWLWIFRSGAQSPQRQQPARRQTHEFSWWKGGVTMRGCPSTGSGVPSRAAAHATTPARRERGYRANDISLHDDASAARQGLSSKWLRSKCSSYRPFFCSSYYNGGNKELLYGSLPTWQVQAAGAAAGMAGCRCGRAC